MKATQVPRYQPPAGQDHDFEPVLGLPEALPAGEVMLWQGSPEWKHMAQHAFHVRKLVVYFAAMVVLRLAVMFSGTATATEMLMATLWMTLLAAAALGGLCLMAWLSARSAVYTLTNRRVVMRIGIVLTLCFNIPLKRIASAGLRLDADGNGDLPLELSGEDRIAWLHLWPHARPWRLTRPEPTLRCIPQAARVAQQLTEAWSQATGLSGSTVLQPAASAAETATAHPSAQPTMAAR